MLIEADALQHRLVSGERFALLDTRERYEWQQGTLPHAQHINVYDYFIDECTDEGIHAMADDVAIGWQRLAIDENVTPVFFEQQVGMRSPRGAWFAWLIGREDSLILNGGVEAWLAAGGGLSPGHGLSSSVEHQTLRGVQPTNQRRWVASRQQMQQANHRTSIILDARRPTEFDGSFVHDCCHRAGRIPEARLLFWEEVLDNGKFRSPEDIAARARAIGLHPEQQIMIYCHRGARAATVLAALKLAGYRHLSIYVGSWHEWAEHHELPLVQGVQDI
ncbi:rhodanese-like domain-containing protein [Pectobacterium polonicum]|uniref:Rhodanese-like domain-containing protein n=1 Tax=Pectobacterium polonicum TaxID=2485124 RepID=A0ABV1P9W9_9GAMM|nr:rhodanese-like domain-containing protein [Pectobacterium polonicum]MDC9818520.1 rhodanese-like domain-containing protein [Pectobacterium polonicum]